MLNNFIDDDELLIALWPSTKEKNSEDENNDAYLRGLTSFYASITELEKNLDKTTIFKEWFTHIHRSRGEEVARNAPPPFVEFLVWLGVAAPGIGISLY